MRFQILLILFIEFVTAAAILFIAHFIRRKQLIKRLESDRIKIGVFLRRINVNPLGFVDEPLIEIVKINTVKEYFEVKLYHLQQGTYLTYVTSNYTYRFDIMSTIRNSIVIDLPNATFKKLKDLQ